MKRVKIAFWIVVIAFLALLFFQNQELFLSKNSLGINLFISAYHSPDVPLAVFFVAFFLAGWLIAYSFGLFERFRVNKSNKELKKTLDSYQTTIETLKQEVEALKPTSKSDESDESDTDTGVEPQAMEEDETKPSENESTQPQAAQS